MRGITRRGKFSEAVVGAGFASKRLGLCASLERYDCDTPATPAQEALVAGKLAVIEDVAERPSSCARCASSDSGGPGIGSWNRAAGALAQLATASVLSLARQRGAVASVLPAANDGALLADPTRAALVRGSVLAWPVGG